MAVKVKEKALKESLRGKGRTDRGHRERELEGESHEE